MKSEFKKTSHQKRKINWEMPDTYVILVIVLLFAFIATYFIPSGTFDRENVNGMEAVIPNTFHTIEPTFLGLMDFFKSIQIGLIESADIIFLILITGGMFEIIERSGALQGAILQAVHMTKGNEFWLIAIISVIFGITGAVGAVGNAIIAFVVVGVIIARTLKLDPIVAVAITFGANFAGFSVAFIHPFTIGIAQSIAELPIFSGMLFRVILFVIFLSITIWYIWRYTRMILSHPEKSLVGVYTEGPQDDNELKASFTTRHKILLIVAILGIASFVFGSIKFQWAINEMAAIFLLISFITGLIAGMHYNTIAKTFLEGAQKLVYGALIVGLARAIIVVLEDAQIIDTIVYALSIPLDNLSPTFAAVGMFIANSILNFFVNSGSGQAMIVMPMMTPLADMLNVTRQVAVQAFQFGDGLTNLIFPTSGILMASLAVANLSWAKWLKWIMPLFTIWFILAIIALMIGVAINWGPF
jgi:uncharacterized ion transporter superfamily protein YfcC